MKFTNAEIVGKNVPSAQYRAEDCKRGEPEYTMSRSDLMDFMLNPHKWLAGVPGDSTESTEWGDLMDTLILSPEQFNTLYCVAPAQYPSKGMRCPKCGMVTSAKSCRECGIPRIEIITQKDWDWNATHCIEWREKQAGKRIIKTDMRERADDATEVLRMHVNVMELIACSETQVMLMADYKDADTGLVIPVKCLLDLVPAKDHIRCGKKLADFKTSLSCNPPEFEKSVFNYDYDAQAALYKDMYVAATGEDRPDWEFVVQENKAPYEVADPLPLLSSDFLEIGRSKYAFALKFYARCLALNDFPSYSIGTRDQIDDRYILEPRDWMVTAAAERPKLKDLKNPSQSKHEISDFRH
jgi:hypothetical protein